MDKETKELVSLLEAEQKRSRAFLVRKLGEETVRKIELEMDAAEKDISEAIIKQFDNFAEVNR